eukprot:4478030-Prymnesium_polylepis.1
MRTVAAVLVVLVATFALSLGLSLVAQARDSPCGLRCGFKPPSPRPLRPTPLDGLLLLAARAFPLDAVLVGAYTLLMLCATAAGVHARCGQIGCGAPPGWRAGCAWGGAGGVHACALLGACRSRALHPLSLSPNPLSLTLAA